MSRVRGGISSVALMIVLAMPAHAALFMWVPGIAGEVTLPDRTGWILIDAASLGHSFSLPMDATRRMQVKVEPIVVKRRMDGNSPLFAQLVATGVAMKDLKLESAIQGPQGSQPMYRVRLTNVLVSSYAVQLAGDQIPMEELELVFESISWIGYKQDKEGKWGPASATCWDFATSKACQPSF